MYLFSTREQFDTALSDEKRWQRLGLALDSTPNLAADVMYSVGDSLTYMKTTAEQVTSQYFTAHRRYFFVAQVLAGTLDLLVAPKSGLTTVKAYSDLSDSEFLNPPTAKGDSGQATGDVRPHHQAQAWEPTRVSLQPSQILVTAIDEAYRILPTPEAELGDPAAAEPAQLVVLHVTVEGDGHCFPKATPEAA